MLNLWQLQGRRTILPSKYISAWVAIATFSKDPKNIDLQLPWSHQWMNFRETERICESWFLSLSGRGLWQRRQRQWGSFFEIAFMAYRWDPLQRRNFLCCGVKTTTQHCAKKMRLAEVWSALAAEVTSLIRSHAIPFFVTALPVRWDKKVMYRKPLNYSWSIFL